ncbi:MAG: hypothetical protein E7559_08755 [Ruminococcaceae bacterium]|nr:hypothetical protein [Oscillospiraceae bacterium]
MSVNEKNGAARQYLNTVCAQLRWKRAREIVEYELEGHLLDQQQAYISEGMEPSAAEAEAVRQMGDPVEVGAQLDAVHRPAPPWAMFGIFAALLLSGLLMRVLVTEVGQRSLFNQLFLLFIGAAAMLGVYFADFSILGKYPRHIAGTLVGAQLLSLILFSRPDGNPSVTQYLLMLSPVALAGLIFNARNSGRKGALWCCGAFAAYSLLAVADGFWSGIIAVMLPCLLLMVYGSRRGYFGRHRLLTLVLGCGATVFSLVLTLLLCVSPTKSNILARILDPMSDPQGFGWLPLRVRELLDGAQFIGLAEGAQQVCNIPKNDYILTWTIHRTGWLSLVVILVLFCALLGAGIIFCRRQRSVLGGLASRAVLPVLALQTVFYIAANLGLGFMTLVPYTLPFFSGSALSMVFNSALVGLMLSALRSDSVIRDSYTEVAAA